MIRTLDPALRCRLAVLAAGVLWSTGGLFIKGLTAHSGWQNSALGITCYRSLFAALCLSAALRGRTRPPARELLPSILFYTLLLSLYVASTQGTSAANAIFLQYTAPVYALVLGPRFFREPFARADLLTLFGAMAGIAVLFLGNFHGGERLPLLLGAGSGAMFGLFLLWLRRMREADPMAVTAWNNLGVAVLAFLALATTGAPDLELLPRALTGHPGALWSAGVLLLMGLVQIAAPYVLFSYGLRRVPALEAGLIALIEPVLNPVWVALLVGERPGPATLAGGFCIVASLAARYTLFRPRRPPAGSAGDSAGIGRE